MRSSRKRGSRIVKWHELKQRMLYSLCSPCFSDFHGCTNRLGNLVPMQFLMHIGIRGGDSRVCISSRLLKEVNAAGTWHILSREASSEWMLYNIGFLSPLYLLQSLSRYLDIKYMWSEYTYKIHVKMPMTWHRGGDGQNQGRRALLPSFQETWKPRTALASASAPD